MKNRPFHERLKFALDGLVAAWRRESSFRTQTALAVLVGMALIWLQPSLVWCAIIGLTISFVLTIELLNSAFEALIDHLHPDRHPEVRIIKDMAAGAVLLASIAAVVIGVLFLITTLWP
jgi:undecaprenol kinase